MKKLILLVFLLTSIRAFSQSSIVFDAGTNIDVGTGADISTPVGGTVTINGTFTGGGTINDGPLPVELAAFTSNISGPNIRLNWVTSLELNNSGFDVERKIAVDNEWTKITFVAGRGNSNVPVNYSYADRKLSSGKYNYRLKQIDNNGVFKYFVLNGEVEIGVPNNFSLAQNYPNPFNPVSKIDFELPVDSRVTLIVYDAIGRNVAVLINNEFRPAGYHTAVFNGLKLSSGVYFYRITTDGFTQTKKMMLSK